MKRNFKDSLTVQLATLMHHSWGVKLDKSEIRKLRSGTVKKRSIQKPCLETHFTAKNHI